MAQTTHELAKEIAQKGAFLIRIPLYVGKDLNFAAEHGGLVDPPVGRIQAVNPRNFKVHGKIADRLTDEAYARAAHVPEWPGANGPTESVTGAYVTKLVRRETAPERVEKKFRFFKRRIPAQFTYVPEMVKAREIIAGYEGDEDAHVVTWEVHTLPQDNAERRGSNSTHMVLSESLYKKLIKHVQRDPNIIHEIFKIVYPHWVGHHTNRIVRSGKIILALAPPRGGKAIKDAGELSDVRAETPITTIEYKPK